MTWASHHAESERAASQASLCRREGSLDAANALYRVAAEAEEQALAALPADKVRTLGITVVSAASLWYKAHAFERAEALAHQWLAVDHLPPFARAELRELLQRVWSEMALAQSGVKLLEGDVIFGVKGGEIVYGGAPLDLVVEKVGDVRALYYRTVEMMTRQPLRRRGLPSTDIQQLCRPWLFQVPPGSYQFAIRIQEPEQIGLFPDALPMVSEVAGTFLKILKATASTTPATALPEVVPDPEYRDAFLKLTRNLAPTGERYGSLEARAGGAMASESIVLLPGNREAINSALRSAKPRTGKKAERQSRHIAGILRALDLDEDWLEVSEGGVEGPHVRISGAGDTLDDVIGPMVNRRVLVDAREVKRGHFQLLDIQLAE